MKRVFLSLNRYKKQTSKNISWRFSQIDAPKTHYKPFAWQGFKGYGLNGYYENGKLVKLDDSQFSAKMKKVLNLTTFGNDCN